MDMLKEVLMEVKEMRKEQNNFVTRIKSLEEENKKLNNKIEQLESGLTRMERAKKNNMVIKGLRPTAQTEDLKNDITQFLKKKIWSKRENKSSRTN